jgi:hypothetical protein
LSSEVFVRGIGYLSVVPQWFGFAVFSWFRITTLLCLDLRSDRDQKNPGRDRISDRRTLILIIFSLLNFSKAAFAFKSLREAKIWSS